MEDDGGEQDYSATSVRQFDARSFLSEYVCIFFLTLIFVYLVLCSVA